VARALESLTLALPFALLACATVAGLDDYGSVPGGGGGGATTPTTTGSAGAGGGGGDGGAGGKEPSFYAETVLDDDPVAYWRLGESSGVVAFAQVGPDGTYADQPSLGESGALAADGNTAMHTAGDGHANMGAQQTMNFAMGAPFSVEAWGKPDRSAIGAVDQCGTGGALISRELTDCNDGTRDGYVLRWRGDCRLEFVVQNCGPVRLLATSGTSMDASRWYHVVGTFDGDTARIYVDGVLAGLDMGAAPNLPDGASFVIGTRGTGSDGTFLGWVDEVAVYDERLGEGAISTHFAVGVTGRLP
jgi:large repetitive protein